jgi:hypothetical protein
LSKLAPEVIDGQRVDPISRPPFQEVGNEAALSLDFILKPDGHGAALRVILKSL